MKHRYISCTVHLKRLNKSDYFIQKYVPVLRSPSVIHLAKFPPPMNPILTNGGPEEDILKRLEGGRVNEGLV